MNNILQDDQNFLVEAIDWQGKRAVKKTAKPTASASRVSRLKNDVLGMHFFAELTKKHPNLQLHVPEVYDFGPSFYIREYIEGQPIIDKSDSLEEAKPKMDKLAKLLADIDRIESTQEIGYIGSSNYRNLWQSIPRWAKENVADKIITDEQAKKVIEISAGLDQYIKPRIAHGDSPSKHAYLQPSGTITLIDYENFTPQAARYFDVAWSYTRLYSFSGSTDSAKYFLSSFIAQTEPVANQAEQLMAVFIQRTLGLQKDADVDAKKGVDYISRAKELFDMVLQNDLRLLNL